AWPGTAGGRGARAGAGCPPGPSPAACPTGRPAGPRGSTAWAPCASRSPSPSCWPASWSACAPPATPVTAGRPPRATGRPPAPAGAGAGTRHRRADLRAAPSGPEALDPPTRGRLRVAVVDEPVVHPVLAALPELDAVVHDPDA